MAGCIGDLGGCTRVTANALDGADAVAVSGDDLYAGHSTVHLLGCRAAAQVMNTAIATNWHVAAAHTKL
jgi:hypothetical protein